MMPGLSDDAARRHITSALDETIVVEAAAGTGKTTALVERIVRVIAAGRAAVGEIVAVTFTEKAAGELKLRIRERLERARAEEPDPDVVARLDRAVQHLEEAHVSTIHGFCADLLRERPVEARVDPAFQVLTEAQATRLFDIAFDRWFQDQLEQPREGLRRSLARASRGSRLGDPDDDDRIERLRRSARDLAEWRDFQAPWSREPFDRSAAIGRLLQQLQTLSALSARPSYAGDNLYLDTGPVRQLAQEMAPIAQRGLRDEELDSLESRLIELRRHREFKRGRKGSGPTYGPGVPRATVLDARASLVASLDDFQLRADADLAAQLHGELLECVSAYETLKRREGALDFLDLLLRARDMVRECADVRHHFQRRFRRLFVDEFQDTDPLQAELLMLLSADDPGESRWERVRPEPGKIFIVGDPKQSIYRFRRADVDVYYRVRRQLEDAGATALELRRSFRSVPALQRLVNAAFGPVMDGDRESLQAEYMPLEPSRPSHPQPPVVVLPVPRPYGARLVTARRIEESLPDAVGAYVDWLVRHSGWTVTERRRPDVRVAVEPRHVCILFRRFVSYGEDVTRRYVDALEARGIRHVLVGGRSLHAREEIETLRAALAAIEWPDDRLSVFATLRGPLFACGDEELLEYYHLGGRFHPFRIPEEVPAHLEPIRVALTWLATLHRRRNTRPVADTLAALLTGTRAHVGLVLRPAGEQALANVLHVSELARQYEAGGGMSFRGFVESLQREAASGAATEAPILEEGSDGVRLMTVHRAKGLEFPIVILADLTARLTPYDASRYVASGRRLCAIRLAGCAPGELNAHRDLELQRERREGERVAYVAATRARDLLVVPAVGDAPYEGGWTAPLDPAIYPALDTRREQTQADGCPTFSSRDSVLERPEGDPATPSTVCPGLHVFPGGEDGEYGVVWWSPEPGVLSLDAQTALGVLRDDLIVRDVPPTVLRERLDSYVTWRESRQAERTAAAVPSLDVKTVTRMARDTAPPHDGLEVTIETLPEELGRPHGARFGSLVHALLSDAPLGDAHTGDTAALLQRLSVAHARILGADTAEVDAAQRLVERVFAHPLLRLAAEAAAHDRCAREVPLTYTTDTGMVVEGTADLVVDSGSGLTVVDFKTDRPDGERLERYRRQVGWYVTAVARASGRQTRGVLMLL
jgi:ATP-dependent helicase/nuclease subunit A